MATVATVSAGGSSSVRVHIGGLAPDVTAQELQERFGRVAASAQCSLLHVELPASRLTPSLSKGFAYVTIVGAAAESVLEDLTKAYHKTKWRGGVLRVARASPDYQQRLQMEWDARDALQQARDAAVEAERLRMQPAGAAVELRTGVSFEGRKKTAFNDDGVLVEEEEMDSEGEDDGEEDEDVKDEEEEWTEDAIQALIAEKLAEEATDTESDTPEDEKAVDEEDVEVTDAESLTMANSTAAPSALSVEEANARRLAALDEKKRKQNDPSSKGFLGKIDVVGGPSGKKITFDDDGEVAEVEDARERGDQAAELLGGESGGLKRAVVTDWLGSDEEDDGDNKPDGYGELDDEKLLRGSTGKKKNLHTLEFDDDHDVDTQEDTEDQRRFALRPEFLGETGKKLFEMQKRFGGDQRFRMDARFIEEEENEYFAHDGDDMEMLAPVVDNLESGEAFLQQFQREEDTDKLALYEQEVIRERDQALDIVAELFPDVDVDKIKYRLEALKNKDPIKDASWMGEQMRYDPRIAATTKYEMTEHDTRSRRAAKDEDEKMEEDEKRLAEEKRQREEKEVLIGGDRFYSASTSLGSLFSRVRKNSEDGEVGEAALDGVFGLSKATVDAKPGGNEPETASAFKLSSLFDFSFGGDSVKTNELAMGEDLLEGGDEDEDATTPWHFTQSFNENGGTTEDPSPRLLADDDEGEGTDKEDDAELDQEEEAEEVKGKRQRVRVKRSLDDFLAFGRTFFGGTTLASLTTKDAKDAWKTQWAERRKKLTLDFKRKRRDALKQKKKQQQALQRHNAKRQKTTK